jgi:hypothetical protein
MTSGSSQKQERCGFSIHHSIPRLLHREATFAQTNTRHSSWLRAQGRDLQATAARSDMHSISKAEGHTPSALPQGGGDWASFSNQILAHCRSKVSFLPVTNDGLSSW